MRPLLALGFVLALAPAAQAQDYAEQQMCFTWLSLAAYHALPEDRRTEFGEHSVRLKGLIEARTDVDTTPGDPSVSAAINAYTGWMTQLNESTGDDQTALREALGVKAEACFGMAPPTE